MALRQSQLVDDSSWTADTGSDGSESETSDGFSTLSLTEAKSYDSASNTAFETANSNGSAKSNEFFLSISPEEIERLDELGSGSYGVVYKALIRGSEVALKVISSRRLDPNGNRVADEKTWRKAYEHEVNVLTKLRHKNIVQFLGACIDEPTGDMYILSDLCLGGDLDDFLRGRSRIRVPLYRRMRMALDISRALQWLHGNNPAVLHRDLKPGNLLIEKDSLSVKVADWGLSTVAGLSAGSDSDSDKRYDARVVDDRPIGTPKWVAPEQISEGLSSRASDVYSYGIILWQLTVVTDDPWPGVQSKQDLYSRIVIHKQRPSLDPQRYPAIRDAPEALLELIQESWDANPDKRPGFDAISGRLEKIVVDCAIPADPSAADFWKETFLREESVRWDKFWTEFSERMPTRSIQEASVECLHKLLMENSAELRGSYSGADVATYGGSVELSEFGKLMANFGPLDQFFGRSDDMSVAEMRSAQSVLDRIADVCSAAWFHGSIDQGESVKRLGGREPGTFLVRFSSQPGAFTVSRVHGNGSVVHARVERDASFRFLDGGEAFPSLRNLIENSVEVCTAPCPGAEFAHLFSDLAASQSAEPGNLDHGYQDHVG